MGSTKKQVEEFLVGRLNVSPQNLIFHVGWFQQTVPQAAKEIREIALLRLDGDLYESTVVCLENLYDAVVPGGFIIIDDYGYLEGCRRAVNEFFSIRKPLKFQQVDQDCIFFRK